MAGPPDGTAPGWDALAPASGSDALAVSAADARSATYVAASADALAVGYRADALAAGDSPTTGDPLAAPVLGDTFGDSLTAYGDATAADRPDSRRAPGRRTPRPGPVPPATAPTDDDRSPGDPAGGRADGRAARTGSADAGRQPRRPAPAPVPRRAARPGVGGSTTATGRTGRPRPGSGTGGTGYSGAGSGTSRTGAAGSSTGRTGYSGAGSGTSRTGGPRGQGPVPTPPRWANRTSRPTGTVPWAGRSDGSGWDDFFAEVGGTSGGSGQRPSGTEVARALLEAFRRSRRNR